MTHLHIYSWGWSHVVKPYRYGQRDNTHSCSWFTYRQDHCFLKPDWPIIQTWQLGVHIKHLANHQLHGKLRPQSEEQALQLLNFKKTLSSLKVQIKDAINIWRKCYFFFLKILQLCSISRLDNLCLVSKWCALWKLEEAPGTVSEVHRDLSPYLECSGCTSFSRQEKFPPQDERNEDFVWRPVYYYLNSSWAPGLDPE